MNQNQQQTSQQGMQADAQKVVQHLGSEVGRLTVEIASLHAILAERDEHIEQLQKIAQERSEGRNGHRVTDPAVEVLTGDSNSG